MSSIKEVIINKKTNINVGAFDCADGEENEDLAQHCSYDI